ncbi:MAG: anaerobic ribonucleoside-triphosphate reductase activating protein [Bacteroidaceae bacterium]|nr:anaerobic ribonucleoside-triphosphate reductase activating protein [Bacteroidaceae bacterium]MBQ9191019.1 anaerobic ribonucleoside-triphosphate reductase activating protein [Bacteroidaceae bacterium]MBR1666139.1 anaerobic ribonucleoside-triphosphate reductase activating protein [Bacteroidaceae bacterium]
MLRILSILEDTTVDGPGFRTSIYCAGCTHHCPGCHNPQSWAADGGREMSVDEIMEVIEADPFANVTFSGGDPMQQPEAFTELARAIRARTQKTIWCYTGYTYETLLRMPAQRTLLQLLDVLVDGPFISAQKDTDLLFRGSANQRLIDIPKSLAKGNVVLWQRA